MYLRIKEMQEEIDITKNSLRNCKKMKNKNSFNIL